MGAFYHCTKTPGTETVFNINHQSSTIGSSCMDFGTCPGHANGILGAGLALQFGADCLRIPHHTKSATPYTENLTLKHCAELFLKRHKQKKL